MRASDDHEKLLTAKKKPRSTSRCRWCRCGSTTLFVILLVFVAGLAPAVFHRGSSQHPIIRRERNERVVLPLEAWKERHRKDGGGGGEGGGGGGGGGGGDGGGGGGGGEKPAEGG
jgi:uncharacterized membrane protein YgcG